MNQTLITQGTTIDELLEAVRAIVRAEVLALPKPEKIKPYLSLTEVCDLTGLSKSTVYQLTHTKQIPHLKRGGKLLFNRQEITGWLESARQQVDP